MKTVAQTLARLNPRKPQDVRVIASLAALIAVALLILATAVYLGSIRQDALQLESEQQVVALNLRSLKRAIAANARDYAWWDDAVRYLALELDETWADANVGPHVYRTFDYDVALVVESDGRPRIAWSGDRRATEAVPAALGPALPDLLAAARQQSGPEPNARWRRCWQGPDDLFIAAASPIVPQPGATLAVPKARRPCSSSPSGWTRPFSAPCARISACAPRGSPRPARSSAGWRVALEGPRARSCARSPGSRDAPGTASSSGSSRRCSARWRCSACSRASSSPASGAAPR